MVSFSHEHLVPFGITYHQLSGQEYKTTAYLKPIWKTRCTFLNSGLKAGLIYWNRNRSANHYPSREYWCSPFQEEEHRTRLPKSKPWCHACLWPWFPISQLLGPRGPKYGEANQRNGLVDFQAGWRTSEGASAVLATRPKRMLSHPWISQHAVVPAGQLACVRKRHDGRSWKVQGDW